MEVRQSAIEGLGLFATVHIPEGAPIAQVGGRLVPLHELANLIGARDYDPAEPYIDSITVGEDLHLVLPPGNVLHFGNHSCDPNLWWDDFALVARRAIPSDAEVTNDYATSSGEPSFSMRCNCGSPKCRSTITGEDWRRKDFPRALRKSLGTSASKSYS